MKHPSIISIFIGILLFTSCNSEQVISNKNIVSVSILPQKYLIEKIVGDQYKVNVMVPEGASPASYEPSPKQITDLAHSALYFRIGEIVFEKTWMDKIASQNPNLEIINLSEGIEMIESNDHHHAHPSEEENPHLSVNPHIWMSPDNMRKMSYKCYHSMIKKFPKDSVIFKKNFPLLLKEIDSIDSLYESSRTELRGLNFLIYHPALSYLAKDYSMVQHVLEFEGKDPSPSHMLMIIKEAKKHNISYIFIQKQFNIENAKSLAREINARILSIDPLSENWDEQMTEIHHILLSN